MCYVLKEIYKEVYGESFKYEYIDSRIKLQKAIYLLENMGIYIGDYSFSWDKHGPYSMSLDYDAKQFENIPEDENISFSEIAERSFNKLNKLVKAEVNYSCVNWVECLASLHYLKNVSKLSDDILIDELVKRKPHLSDIDTNKKAIQLLRSLMGSEVFN